MEKIEEMGFKKIISRKDFSLKGMIISSSVLVGTAIGTSIAGVDYPFIAQLGVGAIYLANFFSYQKCDKYLRGEEPIKEIEIIYQEILNDLAKLSKDMDNKEVIEHFALLSYIYKHHLLSCSKSDNLYHNDIKDIDLLGAIALNGHGVCRHTAVLGRDYFDRLGYDSDLSIGYHKEDEKLDIENLKSLIKNYGYEEDDIIQMVAEEVVKTHKVSEDNNDEKINHMIFKVNDDKNSHFLDVTNDVIFTTNDFKSFRSPVSEFTRMDSFLLNSIYRETGGNKYHDKETLSANEINEKTNNANMKIVHNLDMLFKFNMDNKDKLEVAEDIYSKALKKRKL